MPKSKTGNVPTIEPVVLTAQIEQQILMVRGCRVILDVDLARLYGASTKRLNEAVRRNRDRFPEDFMFRLTPAEHSALRSQIATSIGGRGGRRYEPYAFTEYGAIMAANLLRSEQAVKVSVFVVRAFVKLREMLSAHRELAAKLGELESKLQDHDGQIIALIDAIRSLMSEPYARRKAPIGYHTESKPRRRSIAKNRDDSRHRS